MVQWFFVCFSPFSGADITELIEPDQVLVQIPFIGTGGFMITKVHYFTHKRTIFYQQVFTTCLFYIVFVICSGGLSSDF